MPKYPVLTADQIAAALDLAEIEMDIHEWESSVKLKAFSIDEKDRVLAACTEKDGTIDAKKLLRLLVVHGVKEPQLTMDIVSQKSFVVIERIATEVMKLNGMQTGKGPSAATVADVTFRPES
jgi:uncharacterized protein YrrD